MSDFPVFSSISRGRERLFTEAQDNAWLNWARAEGGLSLQRLASLLHEDVAIGYKARALILLTIPKLSWAPVYLTCSTLAASTYEESFVSDSYVTPFDTFSSELLIFARDLLCESCDVLSVQRSQVKKPEEIVGTYQYRLQRLLAELPFEDGEKVYLRCSSQTSDLSRLLVDERLDERWKSRVDAEARRQIFSSPLLVDSAILKYASDIERNLSPLPYRRELLRTQIEFLIGFSPHVRPISWSTVCRLWTIFPEQEFTSFRREVCILVSSCFISTPEEAAIAEKIVVELRDTDPVLAQYVENGIRSWQVHVEEARAETEAQLGRKQTLLADMRS